MNFDKALGFAESYARSYVAYLFAFFGQPETGRRKDADEDEDDPLKTTLIFGVISAFLGACLSYYGVQGKFPTSAWLAERVALQFAYWTTMGLILFGFLRLTRSTASPMEVVIIVLGVTPVAYAVGGYTSFVWRNLCQLWRDPHTLYEETYFAAVIAQLAVAAIYFPVYLTKIRAIGKWRLTGSISLVMVFMAGVQLFYFAALQKQGYFR